MRKGYGGILQKDHWKGCKLTMSLPVTLLDTLCSVELIKRKTPPGVNSPHLIHSTRRRVDFWATINTDSTSLVSFSFSFPSRQDFQLERMQKSRIPTTSFRSIGLASDDVRKLSNAWQRGKLVLNKGSAPYKSMLGEKSLTRRSSLFLRGEVRTVLTTPSLLSASHLKR